MRAGDLVFHRIKRFFRAADGAIHPLPEQTGPYPSGTGEMWMAPNATLAIIAPGVAEEEVVGHEDVQAGGRNG